MNKLLLTPEEIEIAKAEAERLSRTHKAHPRFEREIYLLEAQLAKVLKHREPMIMASSGVLHPESDFESKPTKHRDRPELREEIDNILETAITVDNNCKVISKTDQLLAILDICDK